MSVKIEIELSDEDLEHFRTMFQQAGRVAESTDRSEILRATRAHVEAAAANNPAGFIRERIEGLGKLIDMVEDESWQLPEEDRARVVRALAYFVDPDDLIPDQTPGLGFLDDAIAVELVLRTLVHEIEAYREFCQFREGEIIRRRNLGLPTEISKEDWLADRRALLHARMKQRRVQPPQGWTVRGLGF